MITSPLAWDESSEEAHWRNRENNQPFFSVFNFNVTHESNIWKNETTYSRNELENIKLPTFFPENSKIKSDIKTNYKNIEKLELKENAFFSVNVVARKKEKNSPETNPYVIKFLDKIDWVPKKIGVFAGKIDYPSYKFFDKYAIKFIMWITNGPTDTSKTFEFTDWKKVEEFTKDLNL